MSRTFQNNIRNLAYSQSTGDGPGIVFLGGFNSDMQGTKALYLEDWAISRGRAFLRFDYSGHGESSGNFLDGCVGDWAEDAAAIIDALTEGPQLLVGSSMGGWISLLLAREMPGRISGLVTIAAAPDFTNRLWAGLSESERESLEVNGRVTRLSAYSEEPYVFTKRLIEDGRRQSIFEKPLRLACPTRMLHGTDDQDVSHDVSLKLMEHAEGTDVRLTLVKGAEHRFSDANCLGLIVDAIEDVSARM